MRTAGLLLQDTPQPDGQIFLPLSAISAAQALTLNYFNGFPFLSVPASTAAQMQIPIGSILTKYGMQTDSQMQWGSTANGGAQALPVVPGVAPGFTSPAPRAGRAPFTGASQLNPLLSPIPKGLQLKAMSLVYQNSAVVTLNQVGIQQTVFANGVAPAVTVLLPKAANGLSTAIGAAQQVTTVSLNIPFLTGRFTEYVIEWDITTPAGGSTSVVGIFLDVAYNYN